MDNSQGDHDVFAYAREGGPPESERMRNRLGLGLGLGLANPNPNPNPNPNLDFYLAKVQGRRLGTHGGWIGGAAWEDAEGHRLQVN